MTRHAGTKRPRDTEQLVIQIITDNPDFNAAQVHKRYLSLVADPAKAVGLSAIQKQLEKLRPLVIKLQEKGLDDEWSISSSITHNISPQSTPTLLKAKRFSRSLDDVFTVRQARWVAHLSSYVNQMPVLLYWADKYANWEKSHTIMFGKFDSSDLDMATFTGYMENNTAALLGKTQPILSHSTGVEFTATDSLDSAEDALVAAFIAEYRALNKVYLEDLDSLMKPDKPKSYYYHDELKSLSDLGYKVYQLWIYAYWLTALSKGAKWKAMPRPEVVEMIKQLREWIASLPEIQSRLEKLLEAYHEANEPIPFTELAFLPVMPSDIIDKAGFEKANESPENAPGHFPEFIKRMKAFDNNKHKLEGRFDPNPLSSKEYKK